MDIPNCNPYDDVQRSQVDDISLARVRNLWFDNYERNLPLIKKWGGLTLITPLSRAIVVGAGFTLDRNIDTLEGVQVPVICCDKVAHRVAHYVMPHIIVALNTAPTDVDKWIQEFNSQVLQTWGLEALKQVWLVAPVTVDPALFDHWVGRIAFVNPLNTCDELVSAVYEETKIEPTPRGDNAGFFAVIVAVILGAKEVAFMGMPYAYASEEEVLRITDGWHVVKLKDVTKDYVYTTLDWIDARREFVNFCLNVRTQAGVNIVNCSEGGILYQPEAIRSCKMSIWRSHL